MSAYFVQGTVLNTLLIRLWEASWMWQRPGKSWKMLTKWINGKDPGGSPLGLCFSKYGLDCGSAAKASPLSLWGMQKLRPHPRPTEWEPI